MVNEVVLSIKYCPECGSQDIVSVYKGKNIVRLNGQPMVLDITNTLVPALATEYLCMTCKNGFEIKKTLVL